MSDLETVLKEKLQSDGNSVAPKRSDAFNVIRRRARIRRTFVVTTSLVIALALASATTLTLRIMASSREGTLITPSPGKTSSDPHFRQAMDEAIRLVRIAPVPPVATEVTRPRGSTLDQPAMGRAGTDHFIDRARWWTVPTSFDATEAWLQQNPPAHMRLSGYTNGTGPNDSTVWGIAYEDASTDAYLQPQLEISVAPYGASSSVIRVDGTDIWITTAPAKDPLEGPFIHVSIAAGCPSSLDGYNDVKNSSKQLTKRMLPSADPTQAMICRYRGPGPGEHGTHLAHTTVLSQADARRLVRASNELQLGSIGLVTRSCPADQLVSNIIVFGYSQGPDVDLWFHPRGCWYVTNGSIFSDSGGSFYSVATKLTR